MLKVCYLYNGEAEFWRERTAFHLCHLQRQYFLSEIGFCGPRIVHVWHKISEIMCKIKYHSNFRSLYKFDIPCLSSWVV